MYVHIYSVTMVCAAVSFKTTMYLTYISTPIKHRSIVIDEKIVLKYELAAIAKIGRSGKKHLHYSFLFAQPRIASECEKNNRVKLPLFHTQILRKCLEVYYYADDGLRLLIYTLACCFLTNFQQRVTSTDRYLHSLHCNL